MGSAPPHLLTALVAGGTGLTGRALLAELGTRTEFQEIVSIERGPLRAARATPASSAKKAATPSRVTRLSVDFAAMPALPHADVAFCCLGTTMKRAGSSAEFRRVDYDYVVGFARAAQVAGVQHLSVISALGASTRSRAFYNRVKGEMEDALAAMDFASLCIVRPSLLTGSRHELRLAERLGIAVGAVVTPFLHGEWRKYRPIPAATVAHAMIETALQREPGIEVLESDEIVLRASP